eukprot:jgi/Picre1/27636/NNA_000600.t1
MDAATDAEIARILAEEHHGGIYEYGYMNEDDSGMMTRIMDTTKKEGTKAAKGTGSRGGVDASCMAKTQEAGRDGALQSSGAEMGMLGRQAEGYWATRTASRAWSDEEEERFKEALSMFGRDWKMCEHVDMTRDARAVASHTQKFLIKALLRGEELPEAMARSGRGYTLSGKPLDPNSSAARAYGLRPKEFLKIVESGFLEVGVHVTTFEVDGGDGSTLASPKQQKKKVSKSGDDEVPARSTSPPPQPTEYAMNRPSGPSEDRKVSLETRPSLLI